jgi:hypothetical protein
MSAGLSALRAFGDGLRRVWRAPWVLAGMWLWVIAIDLPIEWLSSLTTAGEPANVLIPAEHDRLWLALPWLPGGLSPALTVLAANPLHPALELVPLLTVSRGAWLPMAVLQLAILLFLNGGTFDRVARNRRVGASGFFAACGGYFGRFARMTLIVFPLYWLLVTFANPPLAVAAVLALNVIVDYARVRVVVEDRRSALGALGAGFRFVRRHLIAVLVLGVLNALVLAVVMALQVISSAWPPGAPGPAADAAAGLLYAAAGLQLAASQIALFQSQLAHAGYTAAPIVQGPDSPAAEAIRRLD